MGNDPPAASREGTLPQRDLQRNFRLGVINGTAFNIARVFLDTDTVVTWLLIQLRASNIIIGLMGPFLQFCWFIPQLFVSGKVERLPRKITFYRKVVLWRGVALATMVLIVMLIPPGTWMLTAFLTVLSTYGLLTGLSALAFIAMLPKVIAPNRRGTFFGQRLFWGGLFAMGVSSVVGFLLDEPDGLHFPLNFAVIFGLALVCFTLAVSTWSLVREPEEQVRAEPFPLARATPPWMAPAAPRCALPHLCANPYVAHAGADRLPLLHRVRQKGIRHPGAYGQPLSDDSYSSLSALQPGLGVAR